MPPVRGKKAHRMAELAAAIASNTPEFEAAASAVHAAVKETAVRHAKTGKFAESIKKKRDGKKGKTGVVINDAVIYSDHRHALSIEFGHLSGKQPGKGGEADKRKFVPGLHAFTDAVARFK